MRNQGSQSGKVLGRPRRQRSLAPSEEVWSRPYWPPLCTEANAATDCSRGLEQLLWPAVLKNSAGRSARCSSGCNAHLFPEIYLASERIVSIKSPADAWPAITAS